MKQTVCKILSLLLATVLCFALLVGCKEKDDVSEMDEAQKQAKIADLLYSVSSTDRIDALSAQATLSVSGADALGTEIPPMVIDFALKGSAVSAKITTETEDFKAVYGVTYVENTAYLNLAGMKMKWTSDEDFSLSDLIGDAEIELPTIDSVDEFRAELEKVFETRTLTSEDGSYVVVLSGLSSEALTSLKQALVDAFGDEDASEIFDSLVPDFTARIEFSADDALKSVAVTLVVSGIPSESGTSELRVSFTLNILSTNPDEVSVTVPDDANLYAETDIDDLIGSLLPSFGDDDVDDDIDWDIDWDFDEDGDWDFDWDLDPDSDLFDDFFDDDNDFDFAGLFGDIA